MFKTTKMKLVELMILRQDIDRVLEYLGKYANFQIQNEDQPMPPGADTFNRDILEKLQLCRSFLGISEPEELSASSSIPAEADVASARRFIETVDALRSRQAEAAERQKRVSAANTEARAFANLKVSYSELDHLSFLSLRVGKIDPSALPDLMASIGDRAVIVPLGEDNSRVLAAASKKGRFALDSELKRFGFVPLEIPRDFKGVPDEVLATLSRQAEESAKEMAALEAERTSFARIHGDELRALLLTFSLGATVSRMRGNLEATQLVYRVRGWLAAEECDSLMKALDSLTEGRVAIRVYAPDEVPTIRDGMEKVPVQYKHGAVVRSFERMVFSYGAPLYGTIDPTPIVAFFFTLLFGIMFGDVGQGGVFFLLGLALVFNWVKPLSRWRHFGPLFVAIGCASMFMGLLTGEVFANGEILKPFNRWVTGLYGQSEDKILELMPSRDAVGKLLYFFGFTLVIGFIINSMGLIINIINQFSLGRPAKAILSKTGLCGAFFFWYVVFAAVRIAVSGGGIRWFDIVCVCIPLTLLFFAEPLTRLLEGKRPVFENGLFAGVIEGLVELLEIVSTNISNSVSFLRVGAFALSHAVLSYIIFTMSNFVGGTLSPGGILIVIFGNLVIIFLEGLIVAIQVVRLQYYEFFSKFFTETGREFKPFRFTYKD
jgi:V/A-type H+-transporting ATPase subunit I